MVSPDAARRLVDADTVVLAYDLGRSRSFLWRIRDTVPLGGPRGDNTWIDRFELPPGDVLDALARDVHRLMVDSRQVRARRTFERKLTELSDVLLGPVSQDLDAERVVVIADGALHYVPFAALPLPEGHPARDRGTEPEILAAAHEIVYLPSLAVLEQLRARGAERPPAPGTVAVIADPVFSLADPRLDASPGPSSRVDLPEFRRLTWAGREADAILELVPPDERFAALGLDATAEALRDPELADYRFVHVATHGVVDVLEPERSGLVLSRFDADGRARHDAFVTLDVVRRLRLPVEMVVLSACGTGLGEELRGEGLVGLSHAFLQAGARGVLVSLWSIDDRATAELMSALYRGLLVEGLRPAAALRQAQLETRERYPEPVYWAAFQLYGDWGTNFL